MHSVYSSDVFMMQIYYFFWKKLFY